jgi:hypothetical protein
MYDTQPEVDTTSKELLIHQTLKEAQFPAGPKEFSLYQNIQTSRGAHQNLLLHG